MSTAIIGSRLQIRPDLTVKPQLADGMPKVIREVPLVIEYRFKDGLNGSDGEPLISADAKWTYEQQVKESNQILTRFGWEKVTKFETQDDLTVRITFSEPFAPYVVMLAGSATQILPRHVYEGKDSDKAMNDNLVGSGPRSTIPSARVAPNAIGGGASGERRARRQPQGRRGRTRRRPSLPGSAPAHVGRSLTGSGEQHLRGAGSAVHLHHPLQPSADAAPHPGRYVRRRTGRVGDTAGGTKPRILVCLRRVIRPRGY